VRCKHKQQVHQLGADCVVATRCLDCGAWLSLGPANDAGEAVQLEIRAAEIAAGAETTSREWAGLFAFHAGYIPSDVSHAGYLARCITTHSDPSEEGASER
jgi:hypothetical protein